MKAEGVLVHEFKNAGVNIIEPDVDAFREATLAKVPAMFAEEWGEGTFEKLQNSN